MREGTIIGPVIVAIGVVVAAVSFALVQYMLDRAEGTMEIRVERLESDLAELAERLEETEEDLRRAEANTRRLLDDFARIAAAGGTSTATPSGAGAISVEELFDHAEAEELTEEMQLARARFNLGISQPNNSVMLEVLGRPRADLSQTCQPVTDPRLRALLETRQVGPIRVTMIRPALDSLQRIMDRLAVREPDIYNAIGTAGAICARLIRGSATGISNHSWGTAIDITLEGQLDGFGDGGTQFGLLLLAEAFNEEGWYWGATYSREDSMHFEVGVETLREWEAQGLLDP